MGLGAALKAVSKTSGKASGVASKAAKTSGGKKSSLASEALGGSGTTSQSEGTDSLDTVSSMLKKPFTTLGKDMPAMFMEIVLTIVSGGAFGILGIILFIVYAILVILYYIFFVILPILVMYIGIPALIMGVVLALFFMGGHILLMIVFIVGGFLYVRGLYRTAYSLPSKKVKSLKTQKK